MHTTWSTYRGLMCCTLVYPRDGGLTEQVDHVPPRLASPHAMWSLYFSATAPSSISQHDCMMPSQRVAEETKHARRVSVADRGLHQDDTTPIACRHVRGAEPGTPADRPRGDSSRPFRRRRHRRRRYKTTLRSSCWCSQVMSNFAAQHSSESVCVSCERHVGVVRYKTMSCIAPSINR